MINRIYKFIFWPFGTLDTASQDQNTLILPFLHFCSFCIFCSNLQNPRALLLPAPLGQTLWSILNHQSSTAQPFELCFSKHPTMVNRVLEASKPCWAHFLQGFIISKHYPHLFRAAAFKQPLFNKFLQNQVKFRISHFSKLCYVYERSFDADSNELCLA